MDERKRILKLVENGTITAEEGIELLEALGQQKSATTTAATGETTSAQTGADMDGANEGKLGHMKPQSTLNNMETPVNTQPHSEEEAEYIGFEDPQNRTENQSSGQSEEQNKRQSTGFEDIFGKAFNNKKFEEVMGTVRQDLTEFSGKMMTLMNSTLSKMNLGEVESPFGEKVEFRKSYAFDGNEVRGFELNVPNGQITFESTEELQVKVEAHVRTPKKPNDVDTEAQFLEDFIELKDGKLEIETHSKVSQVNVIVKVPKKQYDVVLAKMLTGSCTISDVDAKLVKVKTSNGSIKVEQGQFDHADLYTMNGTIEVRFVKGEDLEAETGNGRIYIDGELREVEAESLNGNVAVTTTSSAAYKVKGSTVAGSVELYIPKSVSLDGRALSNFGKVDLGLNDVQSHNDEEQLLSKSTHFSKIIDGAPVLKLNGESRTGNVIIRYTTMTDV